jgi:hypothetical protein
VLLIERGSKGRRPRFSLRFQFGLRLIVSCLTQLACSGAKGLLPPVKLSDEEKLATLQRLDQFREWRSLDERRYYLSRVALITGRQIQVVGSSPQTGPLRAMCPILSRNLDELGAANRPSAKMSPDPNPAGSSIKKRRIRSRTRSVQKEMGDLAG